MSKIIQAINAMVSNKNKITDVHAGGDNNTELFFLYNKKYKWSMCALENEYRLFYYPEKTIKQPIEQLARWSDQDFVHMLGYYIIYKSGEYKTQEAQESFRELYTILQEKVLDIDRVLEDIIEDFE